MTPLQLRILAIFLDRDDDEFVSVAEAAEGLGISQQRLGSEINAMFRLRVLQRDAETGAVRAAVRYETI